MDRFPFLIPNPPRLSECVDELRKIEESHWFTNFGPVNTRFEGNVLSQLFDGTGAVVTVNNATIGLMLAIAAVLPRTPERQQRRRFAIMPSFTFAATAHAAIWCGLDLLFCDVQRDTWNPDVESVERLCQQYRDEIAVIVPCTTFGNPLDVGAFETLAEKFAVPLVFDAAAALGSLDARGRQTGFASRWPFVYSLHATKAFATGEAGLIYSADPSVVRTIKQMSNFGFDADRRTTMLGLNAKLSEHGALICDERLKQFQDVASHRQDLFASYTRAMPGAGFQTTTGDRRAYQFCPMRLNDGRSVRDDVIRRLSAAGVEARTYFSPALHEMAFFAERAAHADVTNTEWLSARVVNLPIYDTMTIDDVGVVASRVLSVLADASAA